MRGLLLIVCLTMIAGCSSGPIREVSVLNLTDQKIVIRDGKTRSPDIDPERGMERWTLKKDLPIKFEAAGKVLEEYTAEALGFPAQSDGRVLLLVGEPRFLVLADYSEFYTRQGEDPIKDPKIKLVANLRGKKMTALERSDKITWPHQGLAKTKYSVKKKRLLRLVELPEDIEDEAILEFLTADLQNSPPE